MTDDQSWGVPPNMPPPAATSAIPPPFPSFSPPPTTMPPPVPGTGANSQSTSGGTPAQIHVLQPTYADARLSPDKSLGLAYLLWFFVGFLGVHHFYIGKVGRGIGYLLTFGWFLIGLLIDLFTLSSQVKRVNYERQVGLR